MADDLRFPFPEIAHLALAKENRRYAIERNDRRAFQRSGIDPGRHIVIHAVAQPECRPVVRDIRNYRAPKAGLGERLLQNDVFSVKRRKLLLCYVGDKRRPGAERFILRHQPDGDIIAVREKRVPFETSVGSAFAPAAGTGAARGALPAPSAAWRARFLPLFSHSSSPKPESIMETAAVLTASVSIPFST